MTKYEDSPYLLHTCPRDLDRRACKPTWLKLLPRCIIGLALASSVAFAQTPPPSTDFETAEGYTTGSINGQASWVTATGTVSVVSTTAYNGSYSVALVPSTPVAEVAGQLLPAATPGVVFVDFFAKPAAGSSISTSSLFNVGGGLVGFPIVSSAATIKAFDSDGLGGGNWVSPVGAPTLPLTSGQATDWHRFTIREDLASGKWDLSVDGQLLSYDLNLSSPSTDGSVGFAAGGHASATTNFDYIYAGDENPLFEDTARDGIPDSWKTLHGLNPAANLRNVAINGNGTPAIEYYRSGRNPADSFNGRPISGSSPSNSSTVYYSYDASGRLTAATFGTAAAQSYTLDAATNLSAVSTVVQPIVAWRISNGLPADGSGSGADNDIPASDGLPNLAKYALGLSPSVAATGSNPVVSIIRTGGNAYLALEYQRPYPAPADLTYDVEVSADGSSWTHTSGSTVAVSSSTSAGMTTVVTRDATVVGTPSYGRFIRLHVTRNLLP